LVRRSAWRIDIYVQGVLQLFLEMAKSCWLETEESIISPCPEEELRAMNQQQVLLGESYSKNWD